MVQTSPLSRNTPPRLVVHLVYRLDFGGLETVLAECINRMPTDRYRHAIVCLTDYTAFSEKITQPGIEIFALGKKPGLSPGTHWQLWKLLRRLKPTILHTYNLAAIEYAFTAAMAGVPIRVHAEHGRDLGDPEGKNAKHNLLRRMLLPFIDRYVAVSRDLQSWLQDVVGIPESRHCLIHNGVDTRQFHPDAIPMPSWTEEAGGFFVVGTVGRIQDIKNHAGLLRAFMKLRIMLPEQRDRLRLVIIGGGPLMPELKQQVAAAGLTDQVWLPGARADVAMLMRRLSVFVLPSFAEGTPVTLLEAMASGLPVVASNVGGIPEVVEDGESGFLVEPTDENAIASLLANYFRQPSLAPVHGAAGRALIEKNYSIDAMLNAYLQLYDTLCDKKLPNNP